MNIQIFGTSKSFDTKKAQRFFSERKIKVQYIDLREKEMSRGEFNNIKASVGGIDNMVDEKCKDKDLLALFNCLTVDAKEQKLLENQILLKTPIVRNGKKATIGYAPEIWNTWE